MWGKCEEIILNKFNDLVSQPFVFMAFSSLICLNLRVKEEHCDKGFLVPRESKTVSFLQDGFLGQIYTPLRSARCHLSSTGSLIYVLPKHTWRFVIGL